MTPKNLAQHRLDPNMAFWKNLKEGSDYFEAAGAGAEGRGVRQALRVRRCRRRAGRLRAGRSGRGGAEEPRGRAGGRRPRRRTACSRSSSSTTTAASTRASGRRSPRRPAATNRIARRRRAPEQQRLGDVSRPDALAAGPREIVLDPSGKPKDEAPALAYAAAKPAPAAAGPQKPAVAAPAAPAPVTASAAGQQTPFYRRMMSGIGDLFTPNAAPTQAGTAAAPQKTADRPAPSGKITAAAECKLPQSGKRCPVVAACTTVIPGPRSGARNL